ncbi:serine recombinase, partial [Alsobacter soli]
MVRIFEEFATGASPRAIARQLNADAIPGPDGRPWLDTTIRGHAQRGTGIIRNEPATGRRISRPNPKAAWVVEAVPELRIIDDALWDRVAERLQVVQASPASKAVRESRFWEKRRPKHMLTGLVVYGACGHPLAAVGRDYLRCARATRHGLCKNRASVRRSALESIVVEALQHNVTQPEIVAEFVAAVHEELNRTRGEETAQRARLEKRQAAVDRQLEGLITAIADGLRSPGLQARLDALEAERADIVSQLLRPPPSPVRLHPNLAELYGRKVATLQEALHVEETRAEAFEILRSLIDKVIVHAREGGGVEIELIGEIASMVEAASPNAKSRPGKGGLDESLRRSVKVVAGAGFEPA